jgi:hypothetical protein
LAAFDLTAKIIVTKRNPVGARLKSPAMHRVASSVISLV